MKKLIVPALLLIVLGLSCQKPPTVVTVCSTIHGAHQSNLNYTYDILFAFIDSCNPDVIGVELRNEDLDSSQTYLSRSYPFEMREVLLRYNDRLIYGFDWLGTGIEGKAIPENYFKELEVKKLERQLQTDSAMLAKMNRIDSLARLKTALVLDASVEDLNSGRYDNLNIAYYKEMARLFNGTPYQPLIDFYSKRDEQIANNIIEIIKANPGKHLLFLMGADHRSYTLNKLQQEFKNTIRLNEVFKTAS
jgi:pheromone shutdown protein TraB